MRRGRFVRAMSLILVLLLVGFPAWADITTNLINYWPMDQTTGTAVTDTVGTATGTRVNGSAWSVGKVGSNAASLTGGSAYITVGDIAALAGISAFTVALWVKPTTVASSFTMMSQGDYTGASGFNNYTFGFNYATGVRFGMSAAGDNAGFTEVVGGVLTANVWSHVAGTYDGTALRVYVNAGTPASLAKTGTFFNSTLPVWMGTFSVSSAPTDFCVCDLDDVRLYTRALSQSDIQELVNLGTPTTAKRRTVVY